jgi:hypothetical protein
LVKAVLEKASSESLKFFVLCVEAGEQTSFGVESFDNRIKRFFDERIFVNKGIQSFPEFIERVKMIVGIMKLIQFFLIHKSRLFFSYSKKEEEFFRTIFYSIEKVAGLELPLL